MAAAMNYDPSSILDYGVQTVWVSCGNTVAWQSDYGYAPTSTAANTCYVRENYSYWNTVSYHYPQPTPAQVARAKARKEERRQAEERGRQLLVSLLAQEQRAQFEKDGAFDLQVGERLYRIAPGQQVQRLNRSTGKVESKFCIHAVNAHELPYEDWAIAQKLLLETDEKRFLEIANETKVA